MLPSCIILDFDGVVVDSNAIKTHAFIELFSDYPDHLDEIVSLHTSHGGISRFKKLEWIYKDILKQPLTSELSAKLGERFSKLVMDAVVACPMMAGADAFLNAASGKHKLYVASGTPDEELKAIISRRGLERYFDGVYGTPTEKPEIVRAVMADNGLGKNDILFVGDAMTDFDAAKETGVPFKGLVPPGNESPFPVGTGIINKLDDLI